MIGSTLVDRYEIEELLGRGGMGAVYRARDRLLQRDVAVKAVATREADEQDVQRVLSEARSAARVSHSGVVAVHDVVEQNGEPYILMEYVAGKILGEMCPVSWRRALEIMEQVLSAVGFAHSQGVIHRDLKPDNLIESASGQIKVMDFGIAQIHDTIEVTRASSPSGTAYYMAPELADGAPASQQSDLYSLGCVFYELLAGSPPFTGENSFAVLAQHREAPPPPLTERSPGIPSSLEQLVFQLLEKKPAQRPSSAQEVLRRLRMLPGGQGADRATGGFRRGISGGRPVIGRNDLLERFNSQLNALQSGNGTTVLISGEPGIGKTRVVDEVVAQARQKGFRVLYGRCHERETRNPLVPWIDAIERFSRDCQPEAWRKYLTAAGSGFSYFATDSLSKYLDWGESLSQEVGVLLESAAHSDSGAPQAISNFIGAIAQESPVLLVLDDIHWADRLTLECLEALSVRASQDPILIVGTYREVELDRKHPLSRFLVELNRQRLAHREKIQRFQEEDTSQLIQSTLGGSLPRELVRAIHEQTEGNPFFIEEVCQGLLESGHISRETPSGEFAISSGSTAKDVIAEVPQGVRSAIGNRLEQLHPDTQKLLAVASIQGREGSLQVLTALTRDWDWDRDYVEERMEEAEKAGFLVDLQDRNRGPHETWGFAGDTLATSPDFVFTHALIHQTVYGEIPRRQRRTLHERVGRILEGFAGEDARLEAERLVYHFLESNDDTRAIEYSLAAGDKMLTGFYNADLALSYYLPALEISIRNHPYLHAKALSMPSSSLTSGTEQFSDADRSALVRFLGDILKVVKPVPETKLLAQLAQRICICAYDYGEVYEASNRLYDACSASDYTFKLTIETPRGTLSAVLELPGDGGPYPTVAFFHGSISSKEMMTPFARAYRDKGMATVRVDLPGFGETTVPATGTKEDFAILSHMVDEVLAHPRVDDYGLGVIGYSLGPYFALNLAARDDRIRAVVSMSGLMVVGDPRGLPMEPFPEEMYEKWAQVRYEMGMRPVAAPLPPDPESQIPAIADRIRCPVLIVYGAKEPDLYRVQGSEIVAKLPNVREQVWQSGVHILRNIPAAHENAANWLKERLEGRITTA